MSSEGSWRRIASCRCRSSADGSTPTSSTRAVWRGGTPRAPPPGGRTDTARACAARAVARAAGSRHQGVELTDELVMAPRREVRVDRELGGGEPQLLEPADLGIRERLLPEIRERIAAEQRERLARRARRSPGRGRARRLQNQPLEATHVHPARGRSAARTRARASRSPLRPRRAARRAASRRSSAPSWGARRRIVSPQALDQPIRRPPCGWPRARASPTPRAASHRRSRRAGRRCWPQAARGRGCTWSRACRRARAQPTQSPPRGPNQWPCHTVTGRGLPLV